MCSRTVLSTCLLAVAFISVGSAQVEAGKGVTYVVNWDGSGDFVTIQSALDAVKGGEEIVVMPSKGSPAGAYVENITIPAASLTLRSSLPSDPAVVAITIIDGKSAGSVVSFANGAPSNCVVEGFTIRNGSAVTGGGMAIVNGSPVVRNCVITSSSAEDGGGVRVWNGDPVFEACAITGNSATSTGGGVSCMAFEIGHEVTFTNCTISGNSVDGDFPYGGGVYADGIGVRVNGGEVSNNEAGSVGRSIADGGGIYSYEGTLTVSGCTIDGNSATGDQAFGGGIRSLMTGTSVLDCMITSNSVESRDFFGGGGIASDDGDLTVSGGRIAGNTVTGMISFDYGGGGVYASSFFESGTVEISDCVATNNESDGAGGGILFSYVTGNLRRCSVSDNGAVGGGGLMVFGEMATIESSEIVGNTADMDGGGIYVAYAYLEVKNSTIAMNSADETIGFGGGIAAFDSMPVVENSILWGDVSGLGPEMLLSYFDEEVGSHAEVYYSDVAGGEGAVDVSAGSSLFWGDGNIDLDPLFVGGGDVHLTSVSPCVDSGDPGFVLDGELDVDGEDRVRGCRLDMGADETNAPFGDADVDGDVDLYDFAEYQVCFGGDSESCLCLFDFDGSGVVDDGDTFPLTAVLVGP